MITNDVLEFRSKHCKINYHNQCSGKWIGLGFTITCTCNCHKEINEKNIHIDIKIVGGNKFPISEIVRKYEPEKRLVFSK